MNTSQNTYALIYARTATDAGLNSRSGLYQQVCSGIAYAFQNSWLVKKIYLDTGSGLSHDHPGMKELLSDIQNTPNETVYLVVQDLPRLSRDLDHSENLRKAFKSAGVTVHYSAIGGELPDPEIAAANLLSAFESASKRKAPSKPRSNTKKELK